MQVRLLHVPACPNLARARARLLAAIEEAAIALSISETEVATADDAARAGMHGSPTILIDGIDAFAGVHDPPSLSCRLFQTPDGIDGSPTVAQLVSVLSPETTRPPTSGADHQVRELTTSADDPNCCSDGFLSGPLEETGRRLAIAGFAALWQRQALTPAALLPDVGPPARQTAEGLAHRGRAEIDEQGRLVGIHGLTLRPTRHRIAHDGRDHHTWCGFDAIGIPAARNIDATAYTDCPSCNTPIVVEFSAGVPEPQPDLALWLPAANGGNLIADFCSRADLYCSTDHLQQTLATSSAREILTLQESVSLGRDCWTDVAGVARMRKKPLR